MALFSDKLKKNRRKFFEKMKDPQPLLHLICGMLAAFLIVESFFFKECSIIGRDTNTSKVLLFICIGNTSIGLYYYDEFGERTRIFIRFLLLHLLGLFLYSCIKFMGNDYKCWIIRS